MILKRKEIKFLNEGLSTLSIKDKYLMYLAKKNLEILKPEISGITEYLKTSIPKYSEYEEKYKEVIGKYIDKESKNGQILKDKILDYYISDIELKIKYNNTLKLRDKEIEESKLFLDESVDINLSTIDLCNISIVQNVFNNIFHIIKTDFKTEKIILTVSDCLVIRDFLKNYTLELNSRLKYQFAYNLHILEDIFVELNKLKNVVENDCKFQSYNLEKYKLINKYAKKDSDNFLILVNNNVKIEEEKLYEYNNLLEDLNDKNKDILGDLLENNKKIEDFLKTNIKLDLFLIDNDDIPQDFNQDDYEKIFPIIR
jgi:hypothetical protein